MKNVLISVYDNGRSIIDNYSYHFESENYSAVITIDFSKATSVDGWIKKANIAISNDGSGKIVIGDTGSTLQINLTNDMAKYGEITIYPYATTLVGDQNQRIVFQKIVIDIGQFDDLLNTDTSVTPSIAEQIQQEIDGLILTDLQKMNLDGSNSNVEIMSFETAPDQTSALLEGQSRWNPIDHTLDLGMGDDITQQIGMELYYPHCRNNDTVMITNGSLVMYNGTLGNSGVILVKRADPAMALPGMAMGIATMNIPVGSDGRITWFGLIRGIQTNGANYGEVWVDGDVLYNSGSIAGGLSKIKPIAPKSAVQVAVVLRSHSSSGSLLVRPIFFPKLDHLSNVFIQDLQNGDVIAYDSVNGRFYNKHST